MKRLLAFFLPALGGALLLGSVSCGTTTVVHPAPPPPKTVKVPVYQTRYVKVPAAPTRTIPGDPRGVAGTPGANSFRAVTE